MSGGDYEVVLADLTTHAGTLDGIAQGIDQAAGAAETTLGTEAFGVLCQFLPPFISTSQTQTLDAIRALAGQTRSAAARMRAMAADYDHEQTTTATGYRNASTSLQTTV